MPHEVPDNFNEPATIETIVATVGFTGIAARAQLAELPEIAATVKSLKCVRGEILAWRAEAVAGELLALVSFYEALLARIEPVVQVWEKRYAEFKKKKPAKAEELFL